MLRKPQVDDPAAGRGDFGAFYPTGSLVIAFPDAATAQRVRDVLFEAGCKEYECGYFEPAVMAERTGHHLETAGLLSSLGRSEKSVERFDEPAHDGCAFLVVYAPSERETARVMRVVRRGPFILAEKYHRLAIEEIR